MNSNNALSAASHLKTAKQILQWAENHLREKQVYLGHGFDNEWDEALALMLFCLNESWDSDASLLEEELKAEQKEQFLHLVAERVEKRIPVAYLINESWFYGLPFFVNERVLIPRSPLAELIADRFSLWFPENPPKRILDLCTGSACIAIACALEMERSEVDASDISREALKVAEENRRRYELDKRLNLFESDLFSAIPNKAYDLIISNPPYVDQPDMRALPAEYLHEPEMALAAGQDGLDLVRAILNQAASFLSEQGVLVVEVGNSQEALMEQYPQVPFVWLEFEFGGHGVFALRKQDLLVCDDF